MPTYDYRCSVCNESATVIASIAEDKPTPICFKCKKEMTRVFSLGAVTFKGAGFYRNDK